MILHWRAQGLEEGDEHPHAVLWSMVDFAFLPLLCKQNSCTFGVNYAVTCYSLSSVLEAFALTCAVTVALTVYTLQSKRDFSAWAAGWVYSTACAEEGFDTIWPNTVTNTNSLKKVNIKQKNVFLALLGSTLWSTYVLGTGCINKLTSCHLWKLQICRTQDCCYTSCRHHLLLIIGSIGSHCVKQSLTGWTLLLAHDKTICIRFYFTV